MTEYNGLINQPGRGPSPSVSTGTVDLKEAGIAELSYRWRGKTYRQSLAPSDIITRGRRIEGRNRAMVAAYLVWRYGNRCFFSTPVCIMGGLPFANPQSADFDHVDGNRLNHQLGNLRLACNPCNSRMERERLLQWKSSAHTLPHDERKHLPLTQADLQSDTVKLNVDLFPLYEKWLEDNAPQSVKNAIHQAALYLKRKTGHGSSETTRRYLNDLSSGDDSPFIIEEGRVRKR